jgi:predicted alpha/beta-fold hydrolase
LRPFAPFFGNPHLSTLAGNFWPRFIDERRFPSRPVYYQTAPATRVLVEENAPEGAPRGEVLLLHGLEGSSRGGYMLSMAQRLLEAGFRTHRLNLRGCGGTEHLTDTLYHSGLTDDVKWLVENFRGQGRGPLFVVGFSLGGNVTLKFAGEMGDRAVDLVDGVVAVSTPIDLYACVRKMMTPENRIYEWRFVTRLRSRYAKRHRSRPERFPIEGLKGAWTVFDFDDRITAPFFGFGTAQRYYETQSSLQFLASIRVPAFLVQAKDDPLIPFDIFHHQNLQSNPRIRLEATEHGGHLGYIARDKPRFWVDPLVSDWLVDLGNKSRN